MAGAGEHGAAAVKRYILRPCRCPPANVSARSRSSAIWGQAAWARSSGARHAASDRDVAIKLLPEASRLTLNDSRGSNGKRKSLPR